MIIDEKIFKPWLFFNAINHAIFTQLIHDKELYHSSLHLLNTTKSKFEIEMIKSLPKLTQLLNKREILELSLRRIEKEKKSFLTSSSFYKKKQEEPIDFLKNQEDQKIKEIETIDKEIEIYFLYIYKKTYNFLKLKQSAPYVIKEINESEEGKAIKENIFTNILPFINSLASFILREKKAISKLLHHAMIKKVLLEKDNLSLKTIETIHGEIHSVQLKRLPYHQLKIKDEEKLNWIPLFDSIKDIDIKVHTNDIAIELIKAKNVDLIDHIDTLLSESSHHDNASLGPYLLKSSPLYNYKSKNLLKK